MAQHHADIVLGNLGPWHMITHAIFVLWRRQNKWRTPSRLRSCYQAQCVISEAQVPSSQLRPSARQNHSTRYLASVSNRRTWRLINRENTYRYSAPAGDVMREGRGDAGSPYCNGISSPPTGHQAQLLERSFTRHDNEYRRHCRRVFSEYDETAGWTKCNSRHRRSRGNAIVSGRPMDLIRLTPRPVVAACARRTSSWGLREANIFFG